MSKGGAIGVAVRVLVVDDDPGVRVLLLRQLTLLGHNVVEVENGWEAWSVYSDSEGFDLVITDIEMPVMNGLELAARVRDRNPEQRMVFMSASPSMLPTDEFRLSKPFSFDAIRQFL